MSAGFKLTNVQDGYAEAYLPDYSFSFGVVSREEIRTYLDLETGNETTVQRWFVFNEGIPVGNEVHVKVGYPTRKEALDALEVDMRGGCPK